jgi:hypothetical protein
MALDECLNSPESAIISRLFIYIKAVKNYAYLAWDTNQSKPLCSPGSAVLVGAGPKVESSERNGRGGSIDLRDQARQGVRCPPEDPIAIHNTDVN